MRVRVALGRSFIATLLVAVSGAAEEAPPPAKDLFQYALVESVRFRSPGIESRSAIRGLAEVSADGGRLALERGSFPRSTAEVAVSDGKDLYLLDRDERVYARAGVDDLRAMFLGEEPGEMSFGSVTVRDLSVTVEPEAGGAPFEGRPVTRHRVSISWSDALAFPGRLVTVRNRVSGLLTFCASLVDAKGPWDDPSRLFRVKSEVREALERELAARADAKGLLVRAEVDGDSESSFELAGGVAPAGPQERPVTSSFRSERLVSALAVRKTSAETKAALQVPADYRSRSLDRLLVEPGRPR